MGGNLDENPESEKCFAGLAHYYSELGEEASWSRYYFLSLHCYIASIASTTRYILCTHSKQHQKLVMTTGRSNTLCYLVHLLIAS